MIYSAQPLDEQLARMNRLVDQAVKKAVAAERRRCYEICAEEFDVVDGPDGTPSPNLAMRLGAAIDPEAF